MPATDQHRPTGGLAVFRTGVVARVALAVVLQLSVTPAFWTLTPGAALASGPVPTRLPPASQPRELVLDRARRQLLVIEGGRELRRFPVAVGRPGWETPVGRFRVIERVADPVWEHPATGEKVPPGPANPLGSRWIGFHRDCLGRSGFNGREHLVVRGCVSAGFHGTPQRDSVGQAVSHGCVRLFDEHVRELFELVALGTPVTVLP
jgi:L,D-transpeptidase ErfK/SrfK